MKKIIFVLIIICCILTITLANPIYLYPLREFNSTITNINKPIKSIWLVIEDSKDADIREAYRDNHSLDFSQGKEIIWNENDYIDFEEEIDINKEEDFVFDDNYDKKNYCVYYMLSYTFSKPGYSWSHSDAKINKNELLQEFGDLDSVLCKRTATYIAKRLIEEKEIPVSKIKDGTLNIVLTDFTKLREGNEKTYSGSFYSIRFEEEDGEYKTIRLSSDETYNANGKEKVLIDYSNYSYDRYVSNSTEIYDNPILSIFSNIKNNIVLLSFLVVLIVVVIVILLKRKSTTK